MNLCLLANKNKMLGSFPCFSVTFVTNFRINFVQIITMYNFHSYYLKEYFEMIFTFLTIKHK